ncbi:MAG: protein phosphatase 2C domain-containing protein [Actinobacteria bacterium]|nr:protein phosphatase 2C domain-containing protein [Actinomycetota bacterium]
MKVGSASDVGLVRSRNEDDLLAAEDRRLFVVADGLGGHPAGHVASRIAIETIDDRLTLEALAEDGDRSGLLTRTLHEAHRAIMDDSRTNPDRSGMGTTAVLTYLGEGAEEAWVAHVGDSRAYLSREGQLRRITTDHRSGASGRITQALGTTSDIDPDVTRVDLEPGDRLLLCTDGLFDMVDEGLIESVTADTDAPQETCDELVEAAKGAGGADNITVIVVDVTP